MKFMKLGSRPDSFYTAEAIRYVSSELPSDLIVQVQNTRFSLHKFPLLSKCSLLRKLCSETTSNPQILQLPNFPGGSDSFELCAKFCYGITITLSAYNLVSARCASEYLQMTEEAEKGNLVEKLESFFTSCILTGWRDMIVILRTTSGLHSWSEDLNITTRCIESIASKILSNPSKISYSRSGNKWWGDDITELGIGLYHRLLTAVGSKLPPVVIGDVLRAYVSRWGKTDAVVLETVISLLPVEKGAVPCSFLTELMKVSEVSRMELARRAGRQLEAAAVGDLVVPRLGGKGYDVEVVRVMVEEFMKGEFSGGDVVTVGKLVDGYLQVIAGDKDLGVSEFVGIAEGISRVDHDDLYKAIDTYLQSHPELSKSERRRLCRALDCAKLSVEASTHAAQNERLPLRVVVKLLFSENALETNKVSPKSTMTSFNTETDGITMASDDQCSSVSGSKSSVYTLRMRLAEDEDDDDLYDYFPNGFGKSPRIMSALCVIPTKCK